MKVDDHQPHFFAQRGQNTYVRIEPGTWRWCNAVLAAAVALAVFLAYVL